MRIAVLGKDNTNVNYMIGVEKQQKKRAAELLHVPFKR